MPQFPAFAAQLAIDLAPEDLRHVLTLLRGDLARLIEALRLAADAGDRAAFHKAAHGIAGSAGAAGAQTLEIAARAGMAVAKAGQPLGESSARVAGLVATVIAEIDAALNGKTQQ